MQCDPEHVTLVSGKFPSVMAVASMVSINLASAQTFLEPTLQELPVPFYPLTADFLIYDEIQGVMYFKHILGKALKAASYTCTKSKSIVNFAQQYIGGKLQFTQLFSFTNQQYLKQVASEGQILYVTTHLG